MRPADSRVSGRTWKHGETWRFCVTVDRDAVVELEAVSYTAANAARLAITAAVRRALGERITDGRSKR